MSVNVEITPLTTEHLDALPLPPGLDRRAYFSEGSVAHCVLVDGTPVFAGGIVNLQWNRGEAWIVPTPFLRSHLLTCVRSMRDFLPQMAQSRKFARVQATCIEGVSASLFRHLGFAYEGTLRKFGPRGETCDLYCRIFEVRP